MISISEIAGSLSEKEPGFWSSSRQMQISYPEAGNELCRQVEESSFWFGHRNRCIVEIMKRLPPSGPVFDVGGGNGFVSRTMVEAGFEAILVEPGLDGIQNARQRGLSPVIYATLEDAGFFDHTLPAVGLFDTIEHVQDDAGMLDLLARLLVPGGRLYLTTPSYQFLWSKIDEFAGHYRRYTLQSLSRKMQKAGFTLEFETYIFSFLPLPIFLFRTLPGKLNRQQSSGIDPEQRQKQHSLPGGKNGLLMKKILDMETNRIRKLSPIPFGTSCLVVAKTAG